nr:MAG TPA: hypothetical protein [Caudoviricetes sp.]
MRRARLCSSDVVRLESHSFQPGFLLSFIFFTSLLDRVMSVM